MYFYLVLDDPIAVPEDGTFFFTPFGVLAPSGSDETSVSGHMDDIPETPPLAFRYRFLRPESSEPRALHTARTLAQLMGRLDPASENEKPCNQADERAGEHAGPTEAETEEGTLRESTVVEIAFHDIALPTGVLGSAILEDPAADLLMVAIEGLQNLLDAYRIVAYVPVSSARYMSMGGFMMTVEVDLESNTRTPALWFPLEGLQNDLGDTWKPRRSADTLVESTTQWATRLHVGDPSTAYGVHVWEARRACRIDADYEAAALHAAIAAESLLSSVWLALRWEEGADAATSLAKLSDRNRNFFQWVLGQLAQDLKGNWHLESVPELKGWSENTRELRNRIAHLGIRCTRRESEASLEAVYQLQRLIRARMSTQFARFPRANFLLSGSDGIDDFLGSGTWERRACSLIPEDSWFASFAEWVTAGRESRAARFVPIGMIDRCRADCQGHHQSSPS